MSQINVKEQFNVVGDGSTNDTENVNKAIEYANSNNIDYLYFPEGNYVIDYNVDFSKFIGEGTLTFNGMVVQEFPSHPQGKNIKISDLHDDIAMCMQVPNEIGAIEKIDARKKNCGSWQLDDFTFKSYSYSERQLINTWGVVRINDYDNLPDTFTYKIGKMYTFVYRNSTNKWEIAGDTHVVGGFWAKGNSYNSNTDITWDKDLYAYIKYDKSVQGEQGIHFWGDSVKLQEKLNCTWDDIKYVICTYDISVINASGDMSKKLFAYSGGDAKNYNSTKNDLDDTDSILEMCSGRAIFLSENPVRVYATTMDYSNYFDICSQKKIENMINGIDDTGGEKVGIKIYFGEKEIISSSGSGTELTDDQLSNINDVPNKANKSYVDEELNKKANETHVHEITDINTLSNELNNRYTKAETLSSSEIQDLISTLSLGTNWKSPVSTSSDLNSLTGNTQGDARIVQDANVICVYDGTQWVEIGGANITNLVSSTLDGLMSKEDKIKLDSIIIDDLINKTSLANTLTYYAKITDVPSTSDFATKNELNNKVDKDGTKVLSDENYSTVDKNKVTYLWEHKDDSVNIDTSNLVTKSEFNALSNDKSSVLHTHTIDDVTDLSSELNNRYTKAETMSSIEIQSILNNLMYGINWKDSVTDFADLPTDSNSNGDARVVVSEEKIYIWNESKTQWVDIGNSSIVNLATSTKDGLMSSYDKIKLDSIIVSELAKLSDISSKADKTDIPTKLSQLNNDSNYITQTDISNFVTSTNVDSQIDAKLVDYSTTSQNDSKYISKGSLLSGDNINITDDGSGKYIISYKLNTVQSNLISGTYSELKDLKNNNKLVQGQKYLLTDYATKYYNSNSKEIKEYDVEPLILTAVSSNAFEPIVYSPTYPQDIITYSFDNNTCENNSTSRNGFILKRNDTKLNIDFPNDWRNITWYKNGSYVKTFGSNCYNIYHKGTKSDTLANISFGDNCNNISLGIECNSMTFGEKCHNISLGDNCIGNTFGVGCYSMSLGEYCWDNTFGDYCAYNVIGNNSFENVFKERSLYNNIMCSMKTQYPDSFKYTNILYVNNQNFTNVSILSDETKTKELHRTGSVYAVSYYDTTNNNIVYVKIP